MGQHQADQCLHYRGPIDDLFEQWLKNFPTRGRKQTSRCRKPRSSKIDEPKETKTCYN